MSFEFLEAFQIHPIALPKDLVAGATTGDFISMAKYNRCLFLFVKDAGGSLGEDPTITLREAQDAGGTGAQDLVQIDKIFSKQAATDLTSTGVFTILTQTIAATFTNATLAEEAAVLGIDVKASDLSDRYGYVSLNIDDPGVGNAQLACVLAILTEPRFGADVGQEAIV